MSSTVVFISYSHDSDEHRAHVAGLADRLRNDGIDARIDQHVNGTPPQGWPLWMLDQIDEADFVLVVCTETYYRRFRGKEQPGKGKGVRWEGAVITQELYDATIGTTKFVPVMLSPVDHAVIPEPLRRYSHYLVSSRDGYEALLDFLFGTAGIEPAEVAEPRPRERRAAKPFTFEATETASQRVAPSRLTHTADKLFGREKELAALDAAWADPATHVVTLVAWGGVGKTSLVAQWAADLAARDYDGADYFDWSFYSQGTRDTTTASADQFVDAALRFMGDEPTADSARSPWDKGARLAQLVAERRMLLVLDGLEPLQHPPGPLAGELKDPAITSLLKGLAARNAGLCVVTTRERVVDLARFDESTAPRWNLEDLSTPEGVKLLESHGVHGFASDLEKLVEDVHGHALTLNLLGGYLTKAHGGDVRRRDRVELAKADRKKHASNVMSAYERWLEGGGEDGQRQLAILRLLGLFDRPADPGCLRVLRREPVIEDLTEPLVDIDEDDWNVAVGDLIDCRLVSVPDPDSAAAKAGRATAGALDAHPVVREHFGRQLREERPQAWGAAHGRLFDHLKDSTEHQPDTLAGLEPLYQALVHGCLAGRHQEACDAVYFERITRGHQYFSTKQLGAFGADLSAVACFFEPPWSHVSSSLTEAGQVWLLHQTAFRLRAVGRLSEAVDPMRVSMDMDVERGEWRGAAISANHLSELELTLGDINGAVRDAERSVDYADRSGDAFQRMSKRTALAEVLHQAGRRTDAVAWFREAESMQAERQPEYPLLYSGWGFAYCDLLLAAAERAAAGGRRVSGVVDVCREVERRGLEWFKWRIPSDSLLTVALDDLTFGRARFYRAILETAAPDNATAEIEQAIDGLRRAGVMDYLPRGLLTRAWLHCVGGDADGARADLDEAQEIAERGPMPLHLADVNLYRARLFRDRAALAEARRLMEKHGYWRRREEIEDLEAVAEGW